ncbi:hypothetical protein ACO0LL_19300 [Undibacterium sp. TC4M20W]|uniref:hypothetical protein n=1 Tax=Undibacterium sp. TC4M20W TaxID=3413052 RepID=UPI003BF0A054
MTMAIRSIIVDDEEHARITLGYALGKYAEWQVLAVLKNAAAARDFLAQIRSMWCSWIYKCPGNQGWNWPAVWLRSRDHH